MNYDECAFEKMVVAMVKLHNKLDGAEKDHVKKGAITFCAIDEPVYGHRVPGIPSDVLRWVPRAVVRMADTSLFEHGKWVVEGPWVGVLPDELYSYLEELNSRVAVREHDHAAAEHERTAVADVKRQAAQQRKKEGLLKAWEARNDVETHPEEASD